MQDSITAVVITGNHEASIERTLASLYWCTEILVVDGLSSDSTVQIAGQNPKVSVLRHNYVSFSEHCKLGIQEASRPWVMCLRGDQEVSPELSEELVTMEKPRVEGGFKVRIRQVSEGTPLRSVRDRFPIVLYRRDRARVITNGFRDTMHVVGTIGELKGWIEQEDKKRQPEWLEWELRRSERRAVRLCAAESADLSLSDRLRKKAIIMPLWVFSTVFFRRELLKDGLAGHRFALREMFTELLLSARLLEMKLASSEKAPNRFTRRQIR